MMKLNPFARRLLLGLSASLMIGYVCFGAYIWWSMHQPPETFGRVMARMPGPVPFLIFPFETAWLHARSGTLHVGVLRRTSRCSSWTRANESNSPR